MTANLIKSPGLFFSSLADFNNAAVLMVSTRPLIFKSFSPRSSSFGDCTELTNYSWYHGGVRGVMVIVIGNGHSDSSSNLGR